MVEFKDQVIGYYRIIPSDPIDGLMIVQSFVHNTPLLIHYAKGSDAEGDVTFGMPHLNRFHRMIEIGVKGYHRLADGLWLFPAQLQCRVFIASSGYPCIWVNGGTLDAIFQIFRAERCDCGIDFNVEILAVRAPARGPEFEGVHPDTLGRILRVLTITNGIIMVE